MSIDEEHNKKLILKVNEAQEETLKIVNRVLDVAEIMNDQSKDNHEEALKKIYENRAFMNILAKNQRMIYNELLELAGKELEPSESEETPTI